MSKIIKVPGFVGYREFVIRDVNSFRKVCEEFIQEDTDILNDWDVDQYGDEDCKCQYSDRIIDCKKVINFIDTLEDADVTLVIELSDDDTLIDVVECQ